MENKKLYKRKSGWLVEYPFFNKDFIKFLVIRGFSFLLDFLLFGLLQFFMQAVFSLPWLSSAAISYVLFLSYNSAMLILFKGKTLGLTAAKLEVIGKYYTRVNIGNILVKSSITALFALSYVGYGLMIINIICIVLTRGLGMSDVISKTQIVSHEYKKYIKKIEDEYEKEF